MKKKHKKNKKIKKNKNQKLKAKNKLVVNSIYENIKNEHKSLYDSYQFKTKNQKYTLKIILEACVYFIRISCSFNNFKYKKIKPHAFYKNYVKLNKYKIFESTYNNLLNKYLNKNKIKHIYTDTSTFYNKYNTDKVKRNKYFKNKKVLKLSLMTNELGIPLNIDLYSGNMNDSNICNKQLDELNKKLIDKNNSIFMADAGYDSSIIRNKLNGIFNKILIPQNKRNIRDQNKIKVFTNEEKKLYKLRIKIENTFLKIKKNRRLEIVYEKKSENFKQLIFLSLINFLI